MTLVPCAVITWRVLSLGFFRVGYAEQPVIPAHAGIQRVGELDSGSRPAALPGMTQKRTRYVFRALCT
jgi:hypothetical protein